MMMTMKAGVVKAPGSRDGCLAASAAGGSPGVKMSNESTSGLPDSTCYSEANASR